MRDAGRLAVFAQAGNMHFDGRLQLGEDTTLCSGQSDTARQIWTPGAVSAVASQILPDPAGRVRERGCLRCIAEHGAYPDNTSPGQSRSGQNALLLCGSDG